MGTAIFALVSNTATALNTRAIVGAGIISVLVMLMVTYFRTNKVVMSLLFGLFMTSLIITSLVLGITAFNHVTNITNWSVVGL